MKRIVQDLRTFSRTDQAELQQVSLNDEIDRTLALIEPRLKGNRSSATTASCRPCAASRAS